MMYRFGPVNNEGGERRLNVAITRARSRDDRGVIVLRRGHGPGQAARRRRADAVPATSPTPNPAVLTSATWRKTSPTLTPSSVTSKPSLRAAGIPLIAQYGCSGYWIDFAAQHPTRPGQMVLAIECDGATYHSSATARDRDRLRQEHLERLGWTFHRIWSQDWFYHHENETARARAAYDAAVAASNSAREAAWSRAEAQARRDQSPRLRPRSPRPSAPVAGRRRCVPDPDPPRRHREYSTAELVAVIRWIESDTLLRTEDELLAETMRVLGFAAQRLEHHRRDQASHRAGPPSRLPVVPDTA